MELKPCPFCGKSVADCGTIADHEFTDTDSPHYYYDITHYDVVCNANAGGCGASTGKCYDTPELAAEAWNRRMQKEEKKKKGAEQEDDNGK